MKTVNGDPLEPEIIHPTSEEVKLRQSLMSQVRTTPNPLYQSLMELERLGEPYGIETLMDYASDTSDIDERP